MPEKILLAAHQLEEQGQSPFSAESLIVASWQKFPRTFGLKGYTDQYPDSNKILSSLMGEKGLAKRGWLNKMGQKMYSLSRDGRQIAKRMLHEEEPSARVSTSKLTRDQEKFLLHTLDAPAVDKYQEGHKAELTFADACRFWGITENLRGEALDNRLEKLRIGLAEIDQLIGKTGADLSTGRNIAPEDIALVHKVDEYLMDRFSRHLTLVRNRVER